jgi:hypothetical protein
MSMFTGKVYDIGAAGRTAHIYVLLLAGIHSLAVARVAKHVATREDHGAMVEASLVYDMFGVLYGHGIIADVAWELKVVEGDLATGQLFLE